MKYKRSTWFVVVACLLIAALSPLPATLQVGFPVLSRSGNTTGYMNFTGSFTSGNCTQTDANHNLVDAGAPCNIAGNQLHTIPFVIDGAGSAITTGALKDFPTANYTCTINKAQISADQSGSITVDIWKAAGAIPTSANKISASAPVTLSASQLNQNSALTGWTTSVSTGDVFGFNVATAATVTHVVGQLWCQ